MPWKRPPAWLAAAGMTCLALVLAAVILCRLAPGRAPAPPADADALAARASALGWRSYPLSPLTCYVADHPLTDADLEALGRDTAHAPEWQGVVWCERGKASGGGVEAGGWVLYGDPALARKVAAALRN